MSTSPSHPFFAKYSCIASISLTNICLFIPSPPIQMDLPISPSIVVNIVTSFRRWHLPRLHFEDLWNKDPTERLLTHIYIYISVNASLLHQNTSRSYPTPGFVSSTRCRKTEKESWENLRLVEQSGVPGKHAVAHFEFLCCHSRALSLSLYIYIYR